MKKHLIKFVKNNPFLYRQAKKVTRVIRKQEPYINHQQTYLCVYMLNNIHELPLIEQHFQHMRKPQYQLVIVVNGHIENIHELIQSHQHITFLSLDYYEKYHKKLHFINTYFLDYKTDNPMMKYLN